MNLKSLTIILGENGVRLNNFRQDGENTIPQPIEFDPVTEIAIQHVSDVRKKVIKLDKVLMYDYEVDRPALQS